MVLAAVAVSACHKTQNVEAQQKLSEEVPTVAVAKVGASDLSHVLVLTAEFTPFQEVDLMAKVAGYVKNIARKRHLKGVGLAIAGGGSLTHSYRRLGSGTRDCNSATRRLG